MLFLAFIVACVFHLARDVRTAMEMLWPVSGCARPSKKGGANGDRYGTSYVFVLDLYPIAGVFGNSSCAALSSLRLTQATMASYIQLTFVIEEEHPSSEDAYLVSTPRSPTP